MSGAGDPINEAIPSGARGAALFGKIPARPDFVRERFAGPVAQRLDQWLVKSVETLHAARAAMPPVMLRYAFSAPDLASVVVGVLSPSRDQVGRAFPITVFCSVPSAAVSGQLAGVPLSFGPFLSAAEELIREVPALDAIEVLAWLDRLPAADGSTLPAATRRIAEVLRASDAREHLLRTLGDADGAAPAYAYHTLNAALRATTATNAVVLDCPIEIDVDLAAWLKLLDGLMRGRELPSFFWTEQPEARLLVSLGTASTQLLAFIADRAHVSSRLWPLTTKRSEVAEQVRSSMVGSMPPLGTPGVTSLEALIDAVVQRSA